MRRVRVKICGITSLDDLHVAVRAGADAVGFVIDVPQSPRNLTLKEAGELIRSTPVFVDTVAVTIKKSTSRLENICEVLNPDIVQVHGSNLIYREIRETIPERRLICAVQVESDLRTEVVLEEMKMFDAILVDSYVPGKYGGTGTTHDWELSGRLRKSIHPKPLILAGGLTPENVEEAIRMVKPYAVDVSSGVESRPGFKDKNKVLKFFKSTKKVEI
jgi:phosphoribosylanthranilate isomerase